MGGNILVVRHTIVIILGMNGYYFTTFAYNRMHHASIGMSHDMNGYYYLSNLPTIVYITQEATCHHPMRQYVWLQVECTNHGGKT